MPRLIELPADIGEEKTYTLKITLQILEKKKLIPSKLHLLLVLNAYHAESGLI